MEKLKQMENEIEKKLNTEINIIKTEIVFAIIYKDEYKEISNLDIKAIEIILNKYYVLGMFHIDLTINKKLSISFTIYGEKVL